MQTRKLLLVVLGVVVLVGCVKKEPTVPTIGAILPLTGSGAEFGKEEQDGINLALSEFSGDTLGKIVRVRFEDSRSDPKAAISAYDRLRGLEQSMPAAMTVLSSVGMALGPLCERDSVALIVVGANPMLTRGRRFVFQTLPTSSYQMQALFSEAKGKLKGRKVGILFGQDDFGTSMLHAFEQASVDNGTKVVSSEGFLVDSKDFRTQILKVLSARPDVVFLTSYGPSLGLACRQLRELGYKGILFTTIELSYPDAREIAGTSAEGALFVDVPFLADKRNEKATKFVEAFRKAYRRDPQLDAVLAYDETRMLVDAVMSGRKTGAQIASFLRELKDYPTTNGLASTTPENEIRFPLVLKTIKNGKVVLYTE
jgi:branched-chain amino acid transport system substrate-binding protein